MKNKDLNWNKENSRYIAICISYCDTYKFFVYCDILIYRSIVAPLVFVNHFDSKGSHHQISEILLNMMLNHNKINNSKGPYKFSV